VTVFVVARADEVQGRVDAAAVVEALNPGEDGATGLVRDSASREFKDQRVTWLKEGDILAGLAAKQDA
jgi:hypothetical protein